MIDRIQTVCLFVSDQDRAKDFYTHVLGFELRTDAPLYPGATNRWVAVAPSGAVTELILYLPDENWQHYRQVVGQSQAITFNVTDMAATAADLKAKERGFRTGARPAALGHLCHDPGLGRQPTDTCRAASPVMSRTLVSS